MKGKRKFPSLWRKGEGFISVVGKLLFLILLYGLAFLLILEKTGIGTEWIFDRSPILQTAREVSPVGLYSFWLVSLWLGFKIGKRTGLKRGASRERQKLGIPF
jgi:hypothetical protein